MKSMKGEVELKIPEEKAWKMDRDDEIINPDMLFRAQYIQGNCGPGSRRLFQLGHDVRNYVGGELRKIYNPYRVTFSFIPIRGKETEMCIDRWNAEFEPLSPTTPPPEMGRDAALEFLKCIDKR